MKEASLQTCPFVKVRGFVVYFSRDNPEAALPYELGSIEVPRRPG
jgi:hypothetical protein